ncbi:hypothetical protein [Miniphocaeibacter massiliensis]|uniref:hypothetical protein n=1 Tax=Miniphocaeibacter massiliensis TaxID=2041841 RepID=UPI000C1B8F41|nr:hypothetical protein [Miniphocaeibacter massiliensis]
MNRRSKIDKILLIYFILLIVVSLIVGKLFITGNEMGYSVIFFYIIFPISAFVTNFLSSLYGGLMKYLFTILYGVLGVAMPIIVFVGSGYNSISLYFGLIPAIPGFMIGTFIKMLKFKKYRNGNK